MSNNFKTSLLSVCLLLLSIAPAAAEQPNILLILSDDHAKKAVGCYGNTDIKTPSLDRIAAEGMRFNHALTPNSFCTPSRAVVLTGKYSHKNGVTRLNQSFDGSQQTFPKLLQGAGYETSLFGKWHLLSKPTGFNHYCVQKMQGMANDTIVFETGMEWIPWSPEDRKSYRIGGRVLPGYNNDAMTTEALNWLKNKRDPNKPFCMCLHPKPPHQPYTPPKKYEDFLKDVTIPEPATLLDDYKGRTPEAIKDAMTPNRIVLGGSFQKHRAQLEKKDPNITRDELTRAMYQEYIKGYYRLVKSVDDNVGRMLDYLDESGLAENTLVIYTSDQGFSLGEHGFYNKQWMYENPLHQPLLVRFPNAIKPGSVHESMVSHVDLAPTILEYAGVNVPDDMQGHSLKGILEGKAKKVRDAAYYHFYDHGKRLPEMIGVRTETHKLIHYPGMKDAYQWELFDLENDPEEMNNLYESSGHRKTREFLKTELRTLIKKLDDPVEAPALMTAPAPEKAPPQKDDGIPTIFDGKSLDNWSLENGNPVPSGWEVVDGTIHRKAGKNRVGHIVTRDQYGDFDLSFEWKIAKGGNSGVKYRVRKYGSKMLGCEYQIFDKKRANKTPGKQDTGAIYSLFEPDPTRQLNPSGQFNASRIVVRGDHIQHWLNGQLIASATIGSPEWEARVANSKFNDVPKFVRNRLGRIMLTDHGAEVWYRNFKITAPRVEAAKASKVEKRPNIIFLFADDQRADTIGAHGNAHIRTPNLDQLAASGFSFRQNYCAGSFSGAVCVASRAMLMTGKHWMNLDARSPASNWGDAPVLPALLESHGGYQSFIIGKWHNGKQTLQKSFTDGRTIYMGGMANHADFEVQDLKKGKLSSRRNAGGFSSTVFANEAVDFIKSADSEQPFFLYVALMAPHDPRNPPEEYRKIYYQNRPPLPANFLPQHPFINTQQTLGGRDESLAPWPRTKKTVSDQICEYYGLITHLDEQVGRVLDAVKNSPQADNTIVIYTADHGLAMGSHGLLGKQNVYEQSMQCPLMMSGPGVPRGKSSDALTYVHDLYSTICNFAGVEIPKGVDSLSLRPLMNGRMASVRDSLFLPFQDSQRTVRDQRWKLHVYPQINHSLLFDLSNDPHEMKDLAADPNAREDLKRMQKIMDSWRTKLNDPNPLSVDSPQPKEPIYDNEKRILDVWQPKWIRDKYFDGRNNPGHGKRKQMKKSELPQGDAKTIIGTSPSGRM